MTAMTEEVIQQALQGALESGRFYKPEEVSDRATSFWNPASLQCRALIVPTSAVELAGVLKACNSSGQSVITHGGLTGCVAGAESTAEDVIVSTEGMRAIDDIDHQEGVAVVEAGVRLETLQAAAASEGWYFPLDLGARGSCTIGGNIATNAGGINVLRYGMTRNLVLGLEAVTAHGDVVSSMNRMMKNNAGYDVKQIFIGSEGTLGIVTRAVLRLFPRPHHRLDVMVGLHRFEHVIAFLKRMRATFSGSLSAFEVMWGEYYWAVTAEGGHVPPLPRDYAFYVIAQAEGSEAELSTPQFESCIAEALGYGEIADAVVPQSVEQSRALWRVREEFEAILKPAPVYLYDVSLPLSAMETYVQDVQAAVRERWPNGIVHVLGHVADGNLHLFVQPNEEGDFHFESDQIVYGPLRTIGGSISAEHGIGAEKLRWLPHSRSSQEMRMMCTLKTALDPQGILNPGRVIPGL